MNIRFFDHNNYLPHKIQFKKPLCSSECYFFPIRYNKQPIFIKSPKIVVPFGLNMYYDQYSYTLSFTDSDIDDNIEKFMQFLIRIEEQCQSDIQSVLKRYNNPLQAFPDKLEFKSGFNQNGHSPLFKFKISSTTELYNEKGDLFMMSELDKYITKQCHIASLIELQSIWINTDCSYGLTWKVRQIKVYQSYCLMGGRSLLDDTVAMHKVEIIHKQPSPFPNISPAPPLSPRTSTGRKLPKGAVPALPFLSMIKGGFKLKKVDPKSLNKPKKNNSKPFEVSLDEILKIKNILKKPKTLDLPKPKQLLTLQDHLIAELVEKQKKI